MASRPARIALICCLLVLALAGVVTVSSAPPPIQLCEFCDTDISNSSDPETLEIRLDDEGDSQWVERIPLDADTADRYHDDPDRLDAAVEEIRTASFRAHIAHDEVSDLEVTLEGGDGDPADTVLVVTYTVTDLARPGVGDSWLIDAFAVGESTARYQLAAEQVSIHPPADSVVTNNPRYASVDDGVAVWGSTTDTTEYRNFDAQTYVTYGPSGGIVGTVSAYATIILEVGPLSIKHGLLGGSISGIGIALIAVGMSRIDRNRWLSEARLERLTRMPVPVGLGGALAIFTVSALTGGLAGLLSPVTVVLGGLGLGYALLGICIQRFGDRIGTRGLIVLAFATTAFVGVLTWALAGVPVYAFPLSFGLATALCPAIGYASERQKRSIVPVAIAVIAPVVAVAFVAPVGIVGLGPLAFGILLLPWVVVVAVFGSPLVLVGRGLADQQAESHH